MRTTLTASSTTFVFCLVAPLTSQNTLTQIASWPNAACPVPADFRTNELFGVTMFDLGGELWRTDGTGPGTFLLAPVSTGSYPGNPVPMVRMGDRLYFPNWTAATGEELWRTDGTVAGTTMVRDYLPGVTSTLVKEPTACARFVIFRGQTPPSGGTEPFVSDGTFAGTHQLIDLMPGPNGSFPRAFASLGDRAVFLADDGVHGYEFWVTDGTAAGTHLVADLLPSPQSYLAEPKGVAGGRAWYSYGDINNRMLLVCDGTAAGTHVLRTWALPTQTSDLAGFVEAGGRVHFCVDYYSSQASHSELWSTDGTTAGTLSHGIVGSHDLWVVDGRILCLRATPLEGLEPWLFDPATATFTLVHDFTPGPGSSRVNAAAPLANGRAVLLVGGQNQIPGLWSFDATGATPPALLQPAATSLMPVGSRRAFFVAPDGAMGWELWRTDGTASGTQRYGGEVFAGSSGLKVHASITSGGRLLVLGAESFSWGSYSCPLRLWVVDPGAHTLPLGDSGAAGAGSMQLRGQDPIVGTTANLQLTALGGASVALIALDTWSPHPAWLGSWWFYSGFQTPQVLQLTLAPTDPWSAPLAVPPVPALSGQLFVAQGIGLDAVGLTASNGLLLAIGF